MSEIEEKIIEVTLQPSTQRVQTDTIRVHSIGLFTPSSSPTSHSLRTRIRRLFSSFSSSASSCLFSFSPRLLPLGPPLLRGQNSWYLQHWEGPWLGLKFYVTRNVRY